MYVISWMLTIVLLKWYVKNGMLKIACERLYVKNSMLKSYDLYLNNKYKVVLNQKTIERVKNFFQ